MRKKILAFVFAAAVVMAMAVPALGGGGLASANHPPGPPTKVEVCHKAKKTLTIPHQAAAKHVASHGDVLGPC